jgi:Raf kinase inhibitor-like YbhB/YbcL family protein
VHLNHLENLENKTMKMKILRSLVIVVLIVMVVGIGVAAQAPQGGGAGQGAGGGQGRGAGGGGGRGQRGPALTVTSSAWPDGGEVPQKNAGRGGNTSPAFDFSWMQGTMPAMPPANLASYALIMHDIENAGRGGVSEDTLHWMIWDVPGTAKGLPEGMPMGDLPDGTKQTTTNVGRGGYYGPGAGAGPFHHYVFEFYALDMKLNLPNTSTRAQVLAAMEGHIIGKAAFVGRFHATQ